MEQEEKLKPLTDKIHKCVYFKGKISDVTFNINGIRCRRCDELLTESEVDTQTLKDIREILKNKR